MPLRRTSQHSLVIDGGILDETAVQHAPAIMTAFRGAVVFPPLHTAGKVRGWQFIHYAVNGFTRREGTNNEGESFKE